MRDLMRLVENVGLNEIEIGGQVIGDHLGDIKSGDYKSPQHDLFPELPTLEPKLPKYFEQVGRLGSYYVARKQDAISNNKKPEHTYYIFDKGAPAAYIAVIDSDATFGNGYPIHNPPIQGEGLRVISVYVDKPYRGKNLGIRMYEWLLRNVCDYILPDELQTRGGVEIWKRMLNRPGTFDVFVFDENRYVFRRRRAGKDFNQVYNGNHLLPFVTLAGKANELMDNE